MYGENIIFLFFWRNNQKKLILYADSIAINQSIKQTFAKALITIAQMLINSQLTQ